MQWMSPNERRRRGHLLRKQVSRSQHALLDVKRRPEPALALLEHSMRGRVPALIRLKYRLMMESPLGYFRGAAVVMAADLAPLPATQVLCQICGDAHVRNLGAYAAPDGRLLFDINDFDETVRAPFEWDLKRMATSLLLAGRAAGHKEKSARRAAEICVESYATLMQRFAEMPYLEVARFQVHRMDVAKPVHAALLKAERATPLHALETLTVAAGRGKDAERRFGEQPPFLTRVMGAQRTAVLASLKSYRTMLEPQRQDLLALYRPIDVAFKVVGTGSVGLRDYCVYLEGNGPGDPLFLQIKEAIAPVYAPYLHDRRPITHNGQRVADGQRAMQMQSDPFLGWSQIGRRKYLVRQLNDHKGTIDIEDLAGDNLAAYAEVCGELLARGHARSGDPVVLSGYIGSGSGFAEAIGTFSALYADQTEKDWEELKRVRGRKKR